MEGEESPQALSASEGRGGEGRAGLAQSGSDHLRVDTPLPKILLGWSHWATAQGARRELAAHRAWDQSCRAVLGLWRQQLVQQQETEQWAREWDGDSSDVHWATGTAAGRVSRALGRGTGAEGGPRSVRDTQDSGPLVQSPVMGHSHNPPPPHPRSGWQSRTGGRGRCRLGLTFPALPFPGCVDFKCAT